MADTGNLNLFRSRPERRVCSMLSLSAPSGTNSGSGSRSFQGLRPISGSSWRTGSTIGIRPEDCRDNSEGIAGHDLCPRGYLPRQFVSALLPLTSVSAPAAKHRPQGRNRSGASFQRQGHVSAHAVSMITAS